MKAIRKIKARYYTKEVLKYLLLAGLVCIAASSPYFVPNLIKNIGKFKNYKRKPLGSAFDYLKRKGLIEMRRRDRDIYLSLTKEGKKRAGKYQIDELKIERPKKWDKKWRVVIFDIPQKEKLKRNIFRGKIREFGFYPLQKSVWIYPFECREEIELIREFFGLNKNQIQVLLVEKIENDAFVKKLFNLSSAS